MFSNNIVIKEVDTEPLPLILINYRAHMIGVDIFDKELVPMLMFIDFRGGVSISLFIFLKWQYPIRILYSWRFEKIKRN